MGSAQAGEQTRKPLGWKRIVGYAISLVIVIGIFWWAIPKFADYRDVWAAIKTLTPIETWSLVAATIFNLVTYWWANQAALPGLGIGKAAVLTQTTTSVANTLPAGGAIAVGLTYSILDSWGFSGTSVALYVGVTGIWNIFAKLGLPMLALVFLALSGHLTPTYILAAVFGVIVLSVAIGLFAALFRSEEFAIRIGNWLGRVASWFRRLRHKPPVTTWGDGAARFRRDTIALVEHRWFRLSWTTLLSQVALFFVLLLSLRALGVSEQEVSTAEAFAVYAFSRLLSAVPITPGGVGLIDLGYIGGLTAFGGEEKAAIVAAVLLFRALTYGIQIPVGGFTVHHLARQVGLAPSGRRGGAARAGQLLRDLRERKNDPALARDFEVIAVDQRGIGLTDKPRDVYDAGTLAGDLVALMDALGHERFAVVGHDTG